MTRLQNQTGGLVSMTPCTASGVWGAPLAGAVASWEVSMLEPPADTWRR